MAGSALERQDHGSNIQSEFLGQNGENEGLWGLCVVCLPGWVSLSSLLCAGGWLQDFVHARQVLYHRATCPVPACVCTRYFLPVFLTISLTDEPKEIWRLLRK